MTYGYCRLREEMIMTFIKWVGTKSYQGKCEWVWSCGQSMTCTSLSLYSNRIKRKRKRKYYFPSVSLWGESIFSSLCWDIGVIVHLQYMKTFFSRIL